MITLLQNRLFVTPYYNGLPLNRSNNSFLGALFLLFTKRNFTTTSVNNCGEMYLECKGLNLNTNNFLFFVTKWAYPYISSRFILLTVVQGANISSQF